MKLRVLGCGDAFGSGGRFNTSFLVEGDGKRILIDCGASTLIRMKQLSLTVADIQAIIITHFHGDHYGGLPFLIISAYFEHQVRFPLHFFGPRGLKEQVYKLQEAVYPGTAKLLDELEVHFHEYLEEAWIGAIDLQVRAIPVVHAPPSLPHGIQLKIGEKLLGYSGDTEWTDNLIALADQTDLFICECNNWKHLGAGHLAYTTIQEKQSLLNTKRLVLTHMGAEMLKQTPTDIHLLSDGEVVEV